MKSIHGSTNHSGSIIFPDGSAIEVTVVDVHHMDPKYKWGPDLWTARVHVTDHADELRFDNSLNQLAILFWDVTYPEHPEVGLRRKHGVIEIQDTRGRLLGKTACMDDDATEWTAQKIHDFWKDHFDEA